MEHEFVFVDGVNINATHLLSLDPEQAVKEVLANDQVPGDSKAEKLEWVKKALNNSKKEVTKRAEARAKKEAEVKKQQEAAEALAEKIAAQEAEEVVNNSQVTPGK
jgi:uncharacterized membrane protein YukC